jgi:hypothetical protein
VTQKVHSLMPTEVPKLVPKVLLCGLPVPASPAEVITPPHPKP